MEVNKEDVFESIENANSDFLQGNVGAGTGMVCFDLKGGIGSASRIVKLDNKEIKSLREYLDKLELF